MKILLGLSFIFPLAAVAGTGSGDRDILKIGCHRHDTTCFVQISGSAVGPSSCSSTSIRWDVESPNGDAALSHFTAAFFAGKKVDFSISSTCYSEQTNYPTFDWWNVK